MIYALGDLLKKDQNSELVRELLAEFQCAKNQDVEDFLKHKAERFELSHNARTYLILSETMELYAYFSLSFKEIILDNDKISKTVVKNLDGFNKNAKRIRVFLIGQIGKNEAILNNPVTLTEIFLEIFAILESAQKIVGGRLTILECQPIDRLIQLYEQHGFKTLPVVTNIESDMVTMYHVI